MLKRIECERRVWSIKRSQEKTECHLYLCIRWRNEKGKPPLIISCMKWWKKIISQSLKLNKHGIPKFRLFGWNLWTKTTINLIKGSRDLDFSLVSTENLVKYFILAVRAQGPMTSTKKTQTYPTYDVTHKKHNENFKDLLHCKLEDSESFKGLNSSLAQSTGKLWSCTDLNNMGKLFFLKRKWPGPKGVKKQWTNANIWKISLLQLE